MTHPVYHYNNIKNIATRVFKEDCRALIVGDSNSAKYITPRFIGGLCQALKPPRWVGRCTHGPSNGHTEGVSVFNLNQSIYQYAEIHPTGASLFGATGITPYQIANIRMTGNYGFGGTVIQDFLSATGVSYQGGNFWNNRHINARLIYWASSGIWVSGNAATYRDNNIQYGNTTFTFDQVSVLGATGGINYKDFYCGTSGSNNVELRLTTNTSDETNKFFTHYGTQFYEVASSGGAAVSGFSLDTIANGGWRVVDHLNQSICPSGRIREYLKCIRDPNLIIILLGQNDAGTYVTGTWRNNLESLINMYRGICLTNNSNNPPYFLLLSPWNTYEGISAWGNIQNDMLYLSQQYDDVGYINMGGLMGNQRYLSEKEYFDPAEISGSSGASGYGVHLNRYGYYYGAEIVQLCLESALDEVSKRVNNNANPNNRRYKTAYFTSLGVQMPQTKTQHEIVTDSQSLVRDPVITRPGMGYPIYDTVGGKVLAKPVSIHEQLLNTVRTTGINYEIKDGSGDRSSVNSARGQKPRVYSTRGGGGILL
jgi:hypothetical protein